MHLKKHIYKELCSSILLSVVYILLTKNYDAYKRFLCLFAKNFFLIKKKIMSIRRRTSVYNNFF